MGIGSPSLPFKFNSASMLLRLFFLYVLCIQPSFSECPPHWESFQSKCYFHSRAKSSFKQNKELCEGFTAEMVSVHSMDENKFLVSLVKLGNNETSSEHKDIPRSGDVDVAAPAFCPSAWLGASPTVAANKSKSWMDGTSFDYTNWTKEEDGSYISEGQKSSYITCIGSWNMGPVTEEHQVFCVKQEAGKSHFQIFSGEGNTGAKIVFALIVYTIVIITVFSVYKVLTANMNKRAAAPTPVSYQTLNSNSKT